MSQSRGVTIGSALVAVVVLCALATLRLNGAADAESADPAPTPTGFPTGTTFNILSVGEGPPQGKVGDVIKLPPGVDTEEETLAYLQSLANPSPSPSPTPTRWMWPGASWTPDQIPTNDYLRSRGIDPVAFAIELGKGKESPEDLVKRLATR